MEFKLGVELKDLVSSRKSFLWNLKKGMKIDFNINMLNKIDEIIAKIVEMYEEEQKKEKLL